LYRDYSTPKASHVTVMRADSSCSKTSFHSISASTSTIRASPPPARRITSSSSSLYRAKSRLSLLFFLDREVRTLQDGRSYVLNRKYVTTIHLHTEMRTGVPRCC